MSRGAKGEQESEQRITLSREELMRPTTAADATVRTLINAIPDNRLRELFLELALAAIAVPAVKEPKPARAQRTPP